jgi:hypothetical protein
MEPEVSKSNKKSYNYLPLVILFGAAIILFSTNPNEAQFKEFLKKDFKEQARTQGVGILGGPVASLVGLTTQRKDYLIFSTYEIKILGDSYTYLGILNHFFKTK